VSQVTSTRILLLGTENADSTVTGVTTGTSQPVQMADHGIVAVILRSIGTTSGGTVLIEEADWGPLEQVYSGTWSVIATITAASFTGGAQVITHITDSSYRWLRVRISSAITGGGTMTAVLTSRGAL
jgi:hypothetical protein